jgi:hypothetical protein
MRIKKLIAALMLCVLLPATVFAASLRYCAGEDGRQEIEFAHAKDSHATPGMNRSAPSFYVALDALHLAGPHCQDRLLLPEAAKPEACHRRPSRPEPALGPIFRSQVNACLKRRVGPAGRLTALYLKPPDPRLVSIRTVVLLN